MYSLEVRNRPVEVEEEVRDEVCGIVCVVSICIVL
jgi:hypothetical protein